MRHARSEAVYSRLLELAPKGVSSPVRAVDPYPIVAASGRGCRVTDADGNEYIDFCMAYGPLILGHADPRVAAAAAEQMRRGSVFGMPSEPECGLMREIVERIPSAEMVRLANSGTEAAMHAIRLARGFTGRKAVVKIDGGFHGSSDHLMANGTRGGAAPFSAGIPPETLANTRCVEFNDTEQMSDALEGGGVAAVIMEPVMGNAGVVPPEKGYLEDVRRIADENGSLLIFDETITGFRVARGGAQELHGVMPDLTVFGKIPGGGLPIGGIAGRREVMELLAPAGPVYQAGTFSGNPVTAAAGLATLGCLGPDAYASLSKKTESLVSRLSDSLEDRGAEGCVNSAPSMLQAFLGPGRVRNGADAGRADRAAYMRMFRFMLDRGIYIPPSAGEVDFLSTAHDGGALDAFAEAFDAFLGAERR